MDRLTEINLKHEKLKTLLALHAADALWLRRTRNIAWFTAGADASIHVAGEMGAYSVLVTPSRRIIYGSNIEITRLRDEEPFEALGFEYQQVDWYAPTPPRYQISDEGDVEDELQQMRCQLTTGEQARLQALGRDAAAALEEAILAARPGDTEFTMAARLDAACRKRGGLAVVNLVGTDARLYQYRHPVPTAKPLERYGMQVLCMRRGGLIAAASRLIHFGQLPPALLEKQERIAAIDAAVIRASQPGVMLGDLLSVLQQAYAEQQETDEWQKHHQGGLIAYLPREKLALPNSPVALETGHALAWNPSITGCKSEDTILLTEHGTEIITAASPQWAKLAISHAGQTLERPAIMVL